MAVYRHYECPDCRGMFRFLHHPNDEPPPSFCPLCGASMDAEPAFVPTAPHVAKSIGKTADTVYRQMEAASTDHAEMAAAIGGGSASDYTANAITDMADSLRPGDVAAKIASNPVSRHMTQTGQGGFGGAGGMSGAEFARNTSQGAFPRQGEATRLSLVANHGARAQAVQRAGQIAKAK
jgi:hypothetical protein